MFRISRAALDWAVLTGTTALVVWTSLRPPSQIPRIIVRYDKACHFFLYALLFLLAVNAFWSSPLRRRFRPVVPAGMYALLVGALMELLQGGVPGRNPSVADWVADGAGVGVAFLALWAGRRRLPAEMFPDPPGRLPAAARTDSKFPSGFLWGAATSSHQVEGGNVNNDWWEWEASGRTADRSGAACDSFNRYEEDFDLARSFGQNAHRFSVEWSRVEPREGVWDESALRHYRDVVDALRSRGLEPLVTLHHFTNPVWFSRKGGWENPEAPRYFLRYCERAAEALGGGVRYWVTINEPTVFIYHGYIAQYWPPAKCSVRSAMTVMRNMACAHCAAYGAIHALYRRRGWNAPQIGVANAMSALEPRRRFSAADRLAVFLRNTFNNRLFVRLVRHSAAYLPAFLFGTGGTRRALDFIGINYYFREIIRGGGKAPGLLRLAGEVSRDAERSARAERSDLGWEIHPSGLYRLLVRLRRFNLPVMITENGVCTSDEPLRMRFISGHLKETLRAIRSGVKVTGYFYWSLLDNFEWSFGFKPRFGLVHVDFVSGKRTPKESAGFYSKICAENSIGAVY